MEYRTLGGTGTIVSSLCLGTMTFGNESSEEASHAQLDRFLEQGGTFVDTADVYSGASPRRSSDGGWPAAPGPGTRSSSRPRAASRWAPGPTTSA